MIATTLIYIAGLALFIVAGIALFALLDPKGRWLTPAAPAAGAAFLICLAHPLGFLLPGKVAAVLVVLVIAVLLAVGVWRRPSPRRLSSALAVSGGEALTLALGAAAGMLLLAPVFSIGFPTTIAAGIADGWARSVLAEWLIDNPLIDSTQHAAIERPIGTYSAIPHELGAGFEYLVTIVSTLLGRRTFETALPVATLAAPIALGGWAWLHALITDRPPRAWQAAVLAIATLSPLFVLPLGENYLTQCVSLGLWPFAMAATYRFAVRPAVGSAALAAVGLGAIGSVYPQLAPWIGPPAILLVVVMATTGPRSLLDRAGPRLRRPAAALAALGLLGLAVLIVAPIEVMRAYESVVLFSGRLTSNASFPLFQAEQDLQLVLGGASQYTLAPGGGGPAMWQLVPSVALMLAAAAIAAAALWTMRPPERRPLLTLIAGVGGITSLLYLKYKFGDEYGYGAYKALISGGTLLAGLLVLTLASESAGMRTWRLLAAGVCLAIWVPTSAGILQHQRDGNQGFREADRALITAIERLPRKDVVLVEGMAENEHSFRLRLAAGYLAAAFDDRRLDGLGSTFSYFTGGGSQPWRPQRAWRYVIASDAPSAFSARRRTRWHTAPFRIQDAPAVDVTPYALAPDPAIGTGPAGGGRFWLATPSDSPPVDYIAGPVELIVSNRNPRQVRARLDLTLTDQQRGRTVALAAEGGPERRVQIGPKRTRQVAYEVAVPARAAVRVKLAPGAPSVGGDGALRPLLALTKVGVR